MDKMKIFKENIFAWYNFKENSTGIVYCKDTDYVEILGKRINVVSQEYECVLDYAIFIGNENVSEKIDELGNKINDDTRIIVVRENELSAKNLTTYPNSENILCKSEIYTLQNLQNEMNLLGFTKANIYYAFPNYYFADIIFKSTFNINDEQIQKYMPASGENEVRIMDEPEFLKKIIGQDTNMLKVFANSYFVEFTKKENYQDIQYVSFNNTRKEEYRLMTVIKDDIVEKVAVNQNARAHLENAKTNIDLLKKQNINILDYVQNRKYYSRKIKGLQTLDMQLAVKFENLDYVANKLESIKSILLGASIDYNEEIENNLAQYDIDPKSLQNLKFLENGFIDFVPKNCFEIDGKMHFFDQEWNIKFLPVDFIIYRGIINCYDLVKKIKVNELYEKMDIIQYIEIFEKINNKIMDDILDKDVFEEVSGKPITKIDNIINERKIALNQIEDFKTEDLKKTGVIKELQKEEFKKAQIMESLQKEDFKKAQVIDELEQIIKDLKEEEKRKLKYIEELREEENKKLRYIEELREEENKKNKYIQELQEEECKKNEYIKQLQEEENKKTEYIQDLKKEEKNKSEYISALENLKTENETQIDNLTKMNSDKDEIINKLKQVIREKDNEISVYENMRTVKIVKKLRGNK